MAKAAPSPQALQLPAVLYSPQQLSVTIADLRRLVAWHEQQQVRRRVKAKVAAGEPPELAEATVQLLAEHTKQAQITATALDDLLEQVVQLHDTAPHLQVTLAAMPGEGLRQKMVVWLRHNLHPNTIVTFSFDSNLLGGMVVRTPSHILDWSFRRQILAERDKFAGVLRRV